MLKASGNEPARFIYANEDFAVIFGERPAEIVGKTWHEPFDELDDKELLGFIGMAFAENRSTTFMSRQRAEDGAERFTRFSMSLLEVPELDEAARYWLWSQQGEETVDRNGSSLEIGTLQAILRSTLDPIVTTSDMGQILIASDSIERVLGWKPEELIGNNVNLLIAEPHRDVHDEYMQAYRRTGVMHILGQTRQVTARHKKGHDVPVEISVSRVDLPGKDETLFIGIIHDIEERLDAERELERYREHLEALVQDRTAKLESTHAQLRQADRLASLGTLAAGLGHDMNNILLPMRCRLESLAAGKLTVAARSHLEAVQQSIEYLQQLSDGLHLLALDPNDRHVSTKATVIPDWWDQVGLLLGKSLPSHIRLAVSLPSILPPVAVEPHRLTQAVLNLIVNSGEAVGDDGTIRIWGELVEDEPYVRLVVKDNGVGMTPEVMEHALDPFFTTKKRGLGTGLGLSLVRGMVRSTGGSIELTSEPNKGTTVTLLLPVVDTQEPVDETVDDICGERACITLPDRRIASLISAILGEAGYQVCKRTENCPDTCAIWVADAELTNVEEVTRMAMERRRAIIIVGDDSPVWLKAGAQVIADPNDFELLRKTIGDATASLKGGYT